MYIKNVVKVINVNQFAKTIHNFKVQTTSTIAILRNPRDASEKSVFKMLEGIPYCLILKQLIPWNTFMVYMEV